MLGVLTRGEQSQPPRQRGEDTAGDQNVLRRSLRVLSALVVRSFQIISVTPPPYFLNYLLNFSCFTVVKVVQLNCLAHKNHFHSCWLKHSTYPYVTANLAGRLRQTLMFIHKIYK